MFYKYIDRVGRQKREKNNKKIKKLIKTVNNSTYHESLSEEWLERRS